MIASRFPFGRSSPALALLVALALLALVVATAGRSRDSSVDAAPVPVTANGPDLAYPPPQPVDPSAPGPASTLTGAAPMNLGDDPTLDDLYQRCQQGSGAACDQLFDQSPAGSAYEAFGVSCGQRPDILHCAAEMDLPPGD